MHQVEITLNKALCVVLLPLIVISLHCCDKISEDLALYTLVEECHVNSPVTRLDYHDRFSSEAGVQLRILYGTEYGASEHHAKMFYKR